MEGLNIKSALYYYKNANRIITKVVFTILEFKL